MACVATLSRVEIDIFLSSASPGQQAIVRALRDIITRRASGLTERVNTGKELIELKSYLIFEGPGGQLVFLLTSTLSILCSPDVGKVGATLMRPQFGMYRFDWQADGYGIEFHLSHGDMLRVLRANGFEILNLIELAAPAAAEDHSYYDFVPAAWAKQWPAEEIWVARKHPS